MQIYNSALYSRIERYMLSACSSRKQIQIYFYMHKRYICIYKSFKKLPRFGIVHHTYKYIAMGVCRLPILTYARAPETEQGYRF